MFVNQVDISEVGHFYFDGREREVGSYLSQVTPPLFVVRLVTLVNIFHFLYLA